MGNTKCSVQGLVGKFDHFTTRHLFEQNMTSRTGRSHHKRKQVRKACTACRRAHAGCDEGRPCRRCQRHGLPCSEEIVVDTSSGQGGTPGSRSGKRGRKKRRPKKRRRTNSTAPWHVDPGDTQIPLRIRKRLEEASRASTRSRNCSTAGLESAQFRPGLGVRPPSPVDAVALFNACSFTSEPSLGRHVVNFEFPGQSGHPPSPNCQQEDSLPRLTLMIDTAVIQMSPEDTCRPKREPKTGDVLRLSDQPGGGSRSSIGYNNLEDKQSLDETYHPSELSPSDVEVINRLYQTALKINNERRMSWPSDQL